MPRIAYRVPENTNLAERMDSERLQRIGNRCREDYENDLASRSEWDEMVAKWVDLFFMKDKPKNPPWEGASEESIPMLLEACNQSHARAFSEMFQQPGNKIVTAIPVGTVARRDLRDRIDRVSAHMSFQLLVKMPNYRTDKDRMLLACPLYGCMFTKTYFDHVSSRIRVDTIRPMDLIVPYGTGPRAIEDLPRKSQRVWLPMYKAHYLKAVGYFSETPEPADADRLPADSAHDEASGLQPAYDSKDYCLVIEQHRFLDLDGDGLDEPYIVTFDATTGKVLRISIRYETDETGMPTADKEPVEYFTDYQFIPNPNGFYGLGYGMLLQPLNTAVNKLLRQIIDAGTLQNVGNMSGFIDRRLAVAKRMVKLVLGKFTVTESGMEDINKGIFQFRFPGPSNVLADIMRLLTLRGDRLAMVTETITGQAERVMQPTTVLALLEQANIIFSATHTRMLEAWKSELNKIYRLNWKYGAEYEHFIQTVSGEQLEISRLDYAPDLRIIPAADPKAVTKRERLAKSDAEFQTGLQCPFITNNPVALWTLFRRRFEAIGVDDIDELLPIAAMQQLIAQPPAMASQPAQPTETAGMSEQQAAAQPSAL